MTLLIAGCAAAVAIWPDRSAASRVRSVARPTRPRQASEPSRPLAWLFRLAKPATNTTRLLAVVGAVPALVLLWVAGLPGLVAGLLLGRTALKLVGAVGVRRRERREAQGAAVALEVVTAQLRSGATAARALMAAAAELRGAGSESELADSLAHAARRAQFAEPWEVDEPREQLRRIGRLWRVAQRHGLSLAGLLECAREDLRARQAHRSKTAAALSGPRMTIVILACLPLFGLAMGQAFGAAPLDFLSRGIGGIVLVIGVSLVSAGIEWASAIIDRAEAGQ